MGHSQSPRPEGRGFTRKLMEDEWEWKCMEESYDTLCGRYASLLDSVDEYLESKRSYYNMNGWDNEPHQLRKLRELHNEQSLRAKGFAVRSKEEWED
jgi:hypothetical protein